MDNQKPSIDKYESRRIRGQIRRVLLDVWDPIGVKDVPTAQDEYDSYLGDIYELLVTPASDTKVAKYLYRVVHDHMSLESADLSDMESTVKALKEISLNAGK